MTDSRKNICRACLKSSCNVEPFTNKDLLELFTWFTNLKVLENDGHPYKICLTCVDKLNSSAAFLDLCITSDNILKLQQPLSPANEGVTIAEEPDPPDEELFISVDDDIPTECNVVENYEEVAHTDVEIKRECDIIIEEDNYNVNETENIIIKEEKEEEEIIQENMKMDDNSLSSAEFDIDYIEESDEYEPLENEESFEGSINNSFSDDPIVVMTVRENTPKVKKKSDKKVFQPRYLSCTKCDDKFATADDLQLHFWDHVEGTPQGSCHICNRQFLKLEHLYDHVTTHPICPTCGATFDTRGDLQDHQEIHSVGGSVLCHKCGRKFSNGSHLKGHLSLNFCEERPFVCVHCQKAFKCNATLKEHILRHAGTKRHVCSLCGYGCLTKFAYQRHMDSHNDNRPYSCKLCPKKYKAQQSLMAHHKVIHEGVRNFRCEFCDATFRAKLHLINHMRRHTGEKPFVCKICDRPFAQKIALGNHMKIHSIKEIEASEKESS